MELWKSVDKTDTKYIKDGQRGMSSIDAQYYFMKATEKFGPVGIGWGYEVVDRYITEGHTMKGDEQKKDGAYLDYKITQMTIKINFWYMLNGEKGQLTEYGHTQLVSKTRYGPSMEEDPEKKSLTDAIKKSLTLLGFCADVFLGKFDDISYVRELQKEEVEAEEKENAYKKRTINDRINKLVVDAKLNYKACTTIPALNGMSKMDLSDIKKDCLKINRNPEAPLNALNAIIEKRKGELSNVKN